ncbi:uncharacterized protein BYT42DRAFT_619053 [Radiomyces spectabilis]|uniref:uncharacterized protein n=1 Tax=Radiomyces spectabilis TaxID=64574 RepID=UPI0022212AC8|nr:uncharacterized protein BYT42DRAFT_619053 [Radiomyces spectabilis]KAI8363962.1 hypothetical protein BYT42DRAFT_619053 [Radiomyces spectabilis]
MVCNGLPTKPVFNRQVETASSHKLTIVSKVSLSLDAEGLMYEFPAYVLNTKFDLILGRDWIKRMKPEPDWDLDT